MENRANYALVGVFTLAILAGAFGFVYWFNRAGEAGARRAYNLVFVGSVSGLSKGSVVRFNGLRVGEVTEIEIMRNDPSRVIAGIMVDAKTPIKVDTRARLESQGLTGVASVQLTGGEANAEDLVSPNPGVPPTIFADRSDFQDILETVQRLSGKVDSVLDRTQSILNASEGSIISTIRNVEAFSRALADNSSGVASFLANVGDMSQRIGALSGRLERFVDSAETVMQTIDVAAINRTIGHVEGITAALGENKAAIGTIITDAGSLVKSLNASAGKLDSTLEDVGKLAKTFDVEKLNRTLDGAEKFAGSLGRNAETIDQTIKDVAGLAGKANGALDRLEGVVGGVNTFLQGGPGGEGSGAMASINRSLNSVELFTKALGDNSESVSSLLADTTRLARSLSTSSVKLDTALDEFTRLARAVDSEKISRTVESAEKFASALGQNSATVDQTIREIALIAEKVSKAADRLDSVLAGADSLLNGGANGQGASVIAEITEAARAIKLLAANLDKRTGEITVGINRFTGPGLRDIEALASESRKAVGDLSRAVRSLERNPSQLLFGGQSEIPEARRR